MVHLDESQAVPQVKTLHYSLSFLIEALSQSSSASTRLINLDSLRPAAMHRHGAGRPISGPCSALQGLQP